MYRKVGGWPLVNVRGFWALLERETLRFLQRPTQTMLPSVISTVLFIVVFGYFLGPNVRRIEGYSYIVFIFPGLLMMGAGHAAFQNASFSLFISRWDHFIDDLLVAPLSYIQMVLAYVIAALVRGVITGVAVLIAGLLLIDTPFAHPLQLVMALAASSCVFAGAGLIVGLWSDNWDGLAVIQNFVVTPLLFLGGVFYSTNTLPAGYRWTNELNPIYYMVCAIRHSILGRADISFERGITVTITLAVIFFVWVVLLFKKGYKLRT